MRRPRVLSITGDAVRDFATSAFHDYHISIETAEIVDLLKALCTSGAGEDARPLMQAVASQLPLILRFAAACVEEGVTSATRHPAPEQPGTSVTE